MRRFLILWVAAALAFTASAEEQVSPKKYRNFFERYSVLDQHDRAVCATKLEKLLRTHEKLEVEEVMHREGCFDPYSGFRKWGTGGVIEPYKPAVTEHDTDTILFIRIEKFELNMSEALKGMIEAYGARISGFKDVVIDLRGDPGGFVGEMEQALALFASANGVKYITMKRSRCARDKPSITKARGPLAGKHYWILVDEDTASAAEWLTATLRYEWYPKQTTVIGVGATHTYGKDLIQQLSSDDLTMQVTCGYWQMTPERILGVGIAVDVNIPAKVCKTDERDCLLTQIRKLSTRATTASR